MASSSSANRKRLSDDGDNSLSQAPATKKAKGTHSTSSGAPASDTNVLRRSSRNPGGSMGPPSQTPPILPTTPGSWGVQLPNDDSIAAIVDEVTEFMPELKRELASKEMQSQLTNRQIDTNGFLKRLQSKRLSDRPTLQIAELVFRDFEILEGLGTDDARSMSLLQDALRHVRRTVLEKMKVLRAQPAPSTFAIPKIAEAYQQRQRPIHCLRPHNQRGLPLPMLHDVFLSFARDAGKEPGMTETPSKSPSPDPAWTAAQTAAGQLCLQMSDFYQAESQRRDVFNKATEALFGWQKEYEITAESEVHGGKIDSCSFALSGRMLVIREDKLEPGSTEADAYLQACRDYQILVSKLKDEGSPLLAEGVPVFILTVVGPQLTVCGGFWDGKHEIVEPLAPPCLMLPDFGGPREQQLARRLYWLKAGMVSLSEIQGGQKTFHSAVPRIYETFTVATHSGAQGLTLTEPFDSPIENRLLFVAKPRTPSHPDIPQTVEFFVKFTFKRYGVEVHEYLAALNFAPKYYGYIGATTDVTPTGHVMERMPPPTSMEPGWKTLYSLHRDLDPERRTQFRSAIATKLKELLQVLSEGAFVHGDLRSNNIIIKVGVNGEPVTSEKREVEIMAADFDWAGASGCVTFPPGLNTDIEWEAASGDAIETTHDYSMVRRWWEKDWGRL